MLARLFGYAIAVGHIEHNPASFTPGYAVPKRSRVLSDHELRALWQATQDATADDPDDYSMVLRLCLWTGVRRGEAGGLRWSELTDGIWTLPPERTKNGRELVLPLAEQTRDALAGWPRLSGRDRLFGATSAARLLQLGPEQGEARPAASASIATSIVHDCRGQSKRKWPSSAFKNTWSISFSTMPSGQ